MPIGDLELINIANCDLIEQRRPIEHDISVYVYVEVIPSVQVNCFL